MQRFVITPQAYRIPINTGSIGANLSNAGTGTIQYFDEAEGGSAAGTIASGGSALLVGSWFLTATGSPATLTIVDVTGPPPAMEVWRNSGQTIPNNTITDITWHEGQSNGERAQGLWRVAAPTLITFRETGMYLVTLSLDFASNATGIRYANVFKSNWDGNVAASAVSMAAVNGATTRMQVHTHLKVDNQIVGESIKCQVLQTSGGSLDITSDFDTVGFAPVLQVIRITDNYDRVA